MSRPKSHPCNSAAFCSFSEYQGLPTRLVAMPRVSNLDFLATHRQLRFAWLEYPELFACLSYTDQMALHQFFAPSLDAADLALVAHRRHVTALGASLPQRAGRAYARFHALRRDSLHSRGQAVVLEGKGCRARRLSVLSVARPDPDLDRIAKTVIALIEQGLKQ